MSIKTTLIAALLVTIIGWLAAPILALYPSKVYSYLSPKCETATQPTETEKSKREAECADFLARQGQAGDIYGTTTSLFSGLALFGVAFALYADLSHRRKERKPLLACSPSEPQSFSFSKPTDAQPKSFYLVGAMNISSICETALNTSIKPKLTINQTDFSLQVIQIGIPLQAGKELQVNLSDLLPKEAIDEFCKSTREFPSTSLNFKCTCSNLDGEIFESEVTYKINLHFEDVFNKVLSMRHSGASYDGSWDDRAALLLKWELEPGSWKFSSVKG